MPFLEFDAMASPERPLTGFKLPPRTTQASEGHTVRVNDVLFPNRGLRRARILLAQLRCIRPSALWQLFGGERQTQIVLTDIDEVGQALDKPQNYENAGEYTDTNTSITFFEPRDRAGRGTGTRRQIGYGDASAQARAANVVSKPFKGGPRLWGAHAILHI